MSSLGKPIDALPTGLLGVSERDIDLLLLEECYASDDFLRWFVGATSGDTGPVRLVKIDRSVTNSNGESDLELVVETGDGNRALILVENKIAASFQPRQAERYRERGNNRVADGICADFCTILMAPQRYLGGADDRKGFDFVLSYESVLDRFKDRSDRRAEYKAMMLKTAIGKSEHGYELIKDHPVTAFWLRYWELVGEMARELSMPKPQGKPAGATFIRFFPASLSRGIELIHKLPYGRVDLQFNGYGERLMEFNAKYGDHLDRGMILERANKSAVIRMEVPAVDAGRDFGEQIQSIRLGIVAAQALQKWWKENHDS